jgi:hypothetical protein
MTSGLRGSSKGDNCGFRTSSALNDPSELRHGLGIAIDLLKSRATEARLEIATFASMFERFDLDAGIDIANGFFDLIETGLSAAYVPRERTACLGMYDSNSQMSF